MRRPTIACLIGLLPLATGCTVSRQIAANVFFEKKLFHSVEKQEHRIEEDAEELLKTIAGRHPHKEFTHDFRSGFKDGYRDFLIYGGPIRPPASPPPRYRTAKSLTPHGHCKVRDYNLGFLYGAECAEATGKRQFFTLPILVTDQAPPPPLDIIVLPPPPDGLSTDGKKPSTNAETPPMTPGTTQPMTPATPATPPMETPKSEIPKMMPSTDPKPPVPAQPMTPTPMTPTPTTPAPRTPVPVNPLPAQPVPTPKVDPKYDPIPKPVEPPKVDPIPKPTTQAIPVPSPTIPVPIVPASNPNTIPLVPMLPSVSLAPLMAAPTIVPVSGTK